MNNQDAIIIAPIYVGTRFVEDDGIHFRYEKVEFEITKKDVNEHMGHNYSGMFFYIGLQMCWLVTAKYGLLNPFGGFAAIVALLALWRLIVMIAKRRMQHLHPEKELPKYLYRDDDLVEEASEMLKVQKVAEYQKQGKKVLSLQEYRKLVS